jgi:hypothetical protein
VRGRLEVVLQERILGVVAVAVMAMVVMRCAVRVWNGALASESDEVLTVTLPDSLADVYKDVAVTLVDAAETIDS